MSDVAAASAASPAKKPAEPIRLAPIAPLLANEWKARESGVFFNTHEVVPSAATELEHLLRPEFWANISRWMRPGDTIIAFPRTGAWYAELVVFDAGQNWAHVTFKDKPIVKPALASPPGVADEFEIGRDPIDGIMVRRRATGQKVKANFPNAEDARRWIIDHQRALRG